MSTNDALKSIVSTELLPKIKFEVLVADTEPTAGATRYTGSPSGETFYAFGPPVLTNGDIASASVARTPLGAPGLRLVFTPEGVKKLERATEANDRKRLLFVADGEILLAPIIMGPIRESETVVEGSFSKEELKRIVLALSRR